MKPASSIFSITSAEAFESMALDTFAYQYRAVPVYRQFCQSLRRYPHKVKTLFDIPFLPIQFFKSHKVLDDSKKATLVFTSSGTTGSVRSRHFIAETSIYESSFKIAFERFFGPTKDMAILALLPSYFEQEHSSLIYMVDQLIQKADKSGSGFYLGNTEGLVNTLLANETHGKRTLLLGVSYALLDLVEKHSFQLKNTTIMETGGMKGRRKEMIREELHTLLKEGFGVETIYSEYGMTELLSQAYSTGDGIFQTPPWMKVLTRDTEDALSLVTEKTGGINIIDLANRYSCSFIATQDLGKVHRNGSFEILGRFDDSDIRGCNLMVL